MSTTLLVCIAHQIVIFRYVPDALGIFLRFLSPTNKYSTRLQLKKPERHTLLKNLSQRRKLWPKVDFPYTTEQKQVVECNFAIFRREMFRYYIKTCKFSLSVIRIIQYEVFKSMPTLLSDVSG